MNSSILNQAFLNAFRKLSPREQLRNPVMFLVYVGAFVSTGVAAMSASRGAPALLEAQLAVWLWLTVLFANFSEAVAEGRGKAQAEALKKGKIHAVARLLSGGSETKVPAAQLRMGDVVVCETGGVTPADGEVIEGVASVDESAITGESAPVIRESGGDRSAVTGGTRVLSDRIVIRVTVNSGEGFIDRLINLVEGAKRQKTPNEKALAPPDRHDDRLRRGSVHTPCLCAFHRACSRQGRRSAHPPDSDRIAGLHIPARRLEDF